MRRRNSLSANAASEAIDNVFAAVTGVLEQGESVSIRGFGTFKRKYQAERKGRNPATGESMTIAGRDTIKFKEARERS